MVCFYVASAEQTNSGAREGFLVEALLDMRESYPEKQCDTVVRVLEPAAHRIFLLYY